MHCWVTVFLIVGLATIASGKITCYRGINIVMPGNAFFNQTMASLGCNNANYCLRAFGKFGGMENGWFSTCATDDACKSYPACTQVTGGSGEYATSYTACCCKTDKCNDLAFTGVGDGVATSPAPDSSSPTDGSTYSSASPGTSQSTTTTPSESPIPPSVTVISLLFTFLTFY